MSSFVFPTGTVYLGMAAYIDALETQAAMEPLTAAQYDALMLVSCGMALTSIAEVCDVSPLTVKTHLEQARAKLVARSSASATYHAFLCGIFDEPFQPCPALSEDDIFIIRLIARGGVPSDPFAVSSRYKRPASARSALTRLARAVGARNQPHLVRLAWGWGPSPLDCILPMWHAPDA